MPSIQYALRELLDENLAFSDVHIKVNEPMRIRTYGEIEVVAEQPISDDDLLLFLKTAVPEPIDWHKAMRDAGGDMDFAITFNAVRFRCELSWYGGARQLALTMRRLAENPPPLATLGLPAQVCEFIQHGKGLILVTGQTGAGKTTTLASFVAHLNASKRAKITTIEDPIEYVFRSEKSMIVQREIGHDAPNFASALRAALRQDPDVIMIGELRDRETVETALSASETGHLVIASLHTSNARQTVERLTSFFNGEEKIWMQNVLSSVLIGIVSQALVPKLDGSGAALCYETLVNTDAVAQMIRDGKTAQIQNLMVTGRKLGMVTLNTMLAEKIRQQEISVEEALCAAYDVEGLKKEVDFVSAA